jgi:HK97 family phage major capsid protein
MSFKTVAELESEISSKLDRVVAIAEIAKVENRQYSDEEAAEVEAVNASVEKDKKALELQKKIEANIKDRAAKEGAQKILNRSESGDPRPIIKVPARARLHGELKAFKGPKAERNAFVAGQFLAASILGKPKAKKWCKEHGIPLRVDNALSENENDRGGVFVPNEMSLAIIRLVEEFGVARSYCGIEPMASNTKTVPVRVAGMTAYPVGETKTENEGSNRGTQSQPEYTNIELVARKWKAWLKMSDELNEDSAIMVADQVALECAQAFAFAEDNSCFNGDATSAYHGILGILNAVNAGSKHTALAGNTAFSTLDIDDFRTMKGKLPRFPGMQPAWFISPEGYSESMERLLLAANGTLPGDIENGGNLRFLGFPVVLTNVLNSTLTTQINTDLVVLGDLRMGARFGDRRQMTLSSTDQRYWDEDQVAIKATERFDINIHSKGTASAAGAIMVLRTPGA